MKDFSMKNFLLKFLIKFPQTFPPKSHFTQGKTNPILLKSLNNEDIYVTYPLLPSRTFKELYVWFLFQ